MLYISWHLKAQECPGMHLNYGDTNIWSNLQWIIQTDLETNQLNIALSVVDTRTLPMNAARKLKVQDFFRRSYVCAIYILCPRGYLVIVLKLSLKVVTQSIDTCLLLYQLKLHAEQYNQFWYLIWENAPKKGFRHAIPTLWKLQPKI